MTDILSSRTIIILLLCFQIGITHVELYNFKCPVQGTWKIRAKAMCNSTLKYFCLFNNAKQKYVEGCNGPDWDRKGSKRIFSGFFTRGQCKQRRNQPFTFWTNGSMSDCIYAKSLCSEEGQIVYKDDSTKYDRTCRCDYKKNFSFTITPLHIYYCIPSEEDCSCYTKSCPVNFTVSPNYKCIQNGYQRNTKFTDNIKNYTTLEEETRFKIDMNNLPLIETTTKIQWTNIPAATILCCLYAILMSGGCLFAICWQKRTSEQLESFSRRSLERLTDLVGAIYLVKQTVIAVVTHSGYAEDTLVARKKNGMQMLADSFEPIDSANQLESVNGIAATHHEHAECRAKLKAEEINYLRIILLLFRVACPVVRMTFDNEIQPYNLRNMLDRSKHKMEKLYRKNEKNINDTQWDSLYQDKEKTVTSEELDIRLMITILRTVANINVGGGYPVKADTHIVTLLSKIKNIRNEVTRNIEGKLFKNQFNKYWDDIGQAVLNLVSSHKFELTTDKERNRLYGRLLALNPIDIDTETLCRFIDQSERHTFLILQQIISEYCTFNEFTIEDLLIQEKHELYHKRTKETKTCCKCTKEVSTYFRVLSEEQWDALYTVNTDRDSHSCISDEGQCSENFAPKDIKTLDLLVAEVLILNIPNLLKYMIGRLCGNDFHTFLEHNKHTLYHLMEKKRCCQCNKKTIEKAEIFTIDESIWKTLFIKDYKSNSTGSMDCCCRYSARNEIDYLDLEIPVLSKLFHVVGPFGVLYKIEQDPFLYFLNWTVDGQPLQKALQELLNVVEDTQFCDRILPSILSYSYKTETLPKDTIDAKRWLSRNLRHQKALTDQQLCIIVDDNDGLKVESVYLPRDFYLPDKKREFKDITTEENNFLVVFHEQSKIIYPIIKDEFDAQCRQGMLDRIRMKKYGQYCDEFQADVNERPRTIYLTNKQQRQLFLKDDKKPKYLDFKLMIYILKHCMPEVNVDQLVDIENIATEIAQSTNGILEQNEFQDVMNRMKTAVWYFEGNMEDLSRRQRMVNILG